MASSDVSVSTEQKNGRVKWFNNRSGYGFITVTSDGENKDEDIFVHHSALTVTTDQYRYLMLGEYVTFELEAAENSEHKWKACNVRGVDGGKLMCESQKQNSTTSGRRPQNGGRGPRESRQVLPSHVPGHDWVLMKRRGGYDNTSNQST